MKDRAGDGSVFLGVHRDLERLVTTHLFVICPNHSGSTFLQKALATSRRTWNLSEEGGDTLGFVGPGPENDGRLTGSNKIYFAKKRWLDVLADPAAYDWPRNRATWYFQAYARAPRATVFVEKTARFLPVVGDLVCHFHNARFLFMVRNPYAVCEGICRQLRYLQRSPTFPRPALEGEQMETLAARHVATCLELQSRNVERNGDRGVFFTYEALCAEPERVAHAIHLAVPELDDLNLRRRLPVKGRYDAMLTDMNARQIVRLDAGQIVAINREFQKHRAVLDHFGYEIMDPDR